MEASRLLELASKTPAVIAIFDILGDTSDPAGFDVYSQQCGATIASRGAILASRGAIFASRGAIIAKLH